MGNVYKFKERIKCFDLLLPYLLLMNCITFLFLNLASAIAHKDILNAYNNLRSEIANGTFTMKLQFPDITIPLAPAAGMLKLKWNCRLAALAQAYVDSCPSYQDLRVHKPKFPVTYSFLDANLQEHIKDPVLYRFKILEMDFRRGYINDDWFKKLISSKSIGCAFNNCSENVLFVCYYKEQIYEDFKFPVNGGAEPGRFIKELDDYVPRYKEGKACSACPPPTSCRGSSVLCS
ncbi:SCP domain-containing protein [Caenorhabditis elegans]|uniref:SCP domain-containing protein n=1 Tax=Caenorhabditis elegans TaxID=6239 RepID=Q9TZ02_CAEEL|nr:SCP domain-containing protein [Caenorhabditis elegans]CCD64041.1 SCP domain-containing protein [Caenorhabditis elegans]|eukprot:NP_500349.1 Uncharacterized protein CELE_F58E2.5 [Caenorhabditis elegans]